jgi:hypothetical protein
MVIGAFCIAGRHYYLWRGRLSAFNFPERNNQRHFYAKNAPVDGRPVADRNGAGENFAKMPAVLLTNWKQ